MDYLNEIDDKNFELLAGGRLLGRDMAPILKRSKELYTLIHKIIDLRLAGKVGRISKDADDFERVDRLIIEQIKKGSVE